MDSALSASSADASPRLSAYSQPGLGFFSGSQPVHQANEYDRDQESEDHLHPGAVFSFSQPAHIDDMLLNSQLNTQTGSGSSVSSPLQRLVKRMTRLVAKVSCEEALKHLGQHLTKLGYAWKIHTPGVVCVFSILLFNASHSISLFFLTSSNRSRSQHKTAERPTLFSKSPSTTCKAWFYWTSVCLEAVVWTSNGTF